MIMVTETVKMILQKEKEADDKLANAKEKVVKIEEDSKKDAEKIRQKIISDAKAEAEKILSVTKIEIDKMYKEAKAESEKRKNAIYESSSGYKKNVKGIIENILF